MIKGHISEQFYARYESILKIKKYSLTKPDHILDGSLSWESGPWLKKIYSYS
jgi:hypothetical protein